jgi:hypothetical protein
VKDTYDEPEYTRDGTERSFNRTTSSGVNMKEVIEKIWTAAGKPNLNTHDAADHFTAQVAATLHFGSESLGIKGDTKYGRRRNPSGILSDDVIGIKTGSGANDADYFDYIQGAGANGWKFVWNGSSGGPWVAPEDPKLVVGGKPNPGDPGPPDEPEPIDISNIEGSLNEIRIVLGAILQLVDVQNQINDRLVGSVDRLNESFAKFDKVENHVAEIKNLLDNQQKVIVAESHALRDLVNGGIKIKLR